MAKKVQPEVKEKVQTKYDRKVEARKRKEEKDKRDEKIFKIVSACLGVAVAAAIIISAGYSIISRQAALNHTYVKIGDHEVTKVEYDYYYNTTVNNYLTTYASILPYMGLDTSADFADQAYTEELSWKDMFDQMTVDQMTQTFALIDDAAANGFSYDDTEEYSTLSASMEEAAEAAGVSVSKYYKSVYGNYATKSNMEVNERNGFLAQAYYNSLLEKNKPEQEEIDTYYEENKQSYDKVDYRSFAFTAEPVEGASEEETAAAMKELKKQADAFMEARKSGEDFEALCIENAAEDMKANYEDTETEFSLTEGSYYSGVPSVISSWLYEEGRDEGDITVIEDAANNQYYVVEFVDRYYDKADDENISNTIASGKVTEYIAGLVENYNVTDVKGDLKYLTIDLNAAEEENSDSTDTNETTGSANEGAADTGETTDEASEGTGTDSDSTDEVSE